MPMNNKEEAASAGDANSVADVRKSSRVRKERFPGVVAEVVEEQENTHPNAAESNPTDDEIRKPKKPRKVSTYGPPKATVKKKQAMKTRTLADMIETYGANHSIELFEA